MAEFEVTPYPTYAYKDDATAEWRIPIRVWIHKNRGLAERLEHFLTDLTIPDGKERENFELRAVDLIADGVDRETVSFTFDDDPNKRSYQVMDEKGNPVRTSRNGLVEGILTLDEAHNGWLTDSVIRG